MQESVGPYRVLEEIGRGGMGVVFRAHDERLDRIVAIKALPEELAGDAFRLERLEREAKALASLNHPNLAGIYGVEEQDGKKFLVLEYVGGETLADVLERGPVAVDDAVELCVQVAAGLEAAHEAGVIHRDLKPANIKVDEDGAIKVLDFGLARKDDGQSSSSMTQAPTEGGFTNSPTIPGAILGTAAYMSPEQARGKKIDKRTDIWSFGVLLYELLVGVSPFVGETASDSIGAVLHKDINLAHLPAGVPPHVRRVLDRCLERDKNLRYRDIGDVRIELLRGGEWRALPLEGESPKRAASPLLIAAAAVLSAACVGVAWWVTTSASASEPRPVRKLNIVTAEPGEQFSMSWPQISPDGDRVGFIRDEMIHMRDLSAFETRPVPGTEEARQICWSPDGQWLAFSTGKGIFKTPSTGGGVTKLADIEVNFPFGWTQDDRIITSNSAESKDEIIEIPARGGTPRVLLAGDEEMIDFHVTAAIPGTDVLLFVRHRNDGRTPIEAWDGERSATVIDMDDTYMSTFAWSPTGHVLFTRGFGEPELWAVPFSPRRMEVTGDPFLVMPNATSPSVSANGTLTVLRGASLESGELVWVSLDGSVEVIGSTGELAINPLVSPDGTRVAFASGSSPPDLDLWVRDLERGVNSRVADLDSFILPVAWSADGSTIAAATFDPSNRDDGQKTLFFAADGTGQTREPYVGLVTSISDDWTTAVSISDPQQREVTISAINLGDFSVLNEVLTTRGSFLSPQLSPDTTLMLYSSLEEDELQVYCTRFPSGEGRWQVSTDGGRFPSWSRDGSAIYYQTSEALFRVRVTREPDLRFGVPERLFEIDSISDNFNGTLTPAPDGERFVTVRPRQAEQKKAEPQSISVIENWYEEYRPRRD